MTLADCCLIVDLIKYYNKINIDIFIYEFDDIFDRCSDHINIIKCHEQSY